MASNASVALPAVAAGCNSSSETFQHTMHACQLFDNAAPITAISFDLDDTLWDNSCVLTSAAEAAQAWLLQQEPKLADVLCEASLSSRMMSLQKARPDIAHCYTALRSAAMHEALAYAGTAPDKHADLVRQGMEEYSKARSNVTLWPGIVTALNELRKRGYALAALTNGNVSVELIPELAGVFDAFVSPAVAGHAKPHRRPFEMVCEALGAPPSQVLHVGDSWEHDVLGAVGVGMPAAWLNVRAHDLPPLEAAGLQCWAVTSHIAALLDHLPAREAPHTVQQ
jgi:putative hydrolase of the HAD superfamily